MALLSFFYRGVQFVCKPFVSLQQRAKNKLFQIEKKKAQKSAMRVYPDANEKDAFFEQFTLITHAGGGLQGIAYLNSKQAFEQYYQNGNRVFEYDVDMTEDGRYILSHLSKEEREKERLDQRFPPLSLEECFYLIREYKDVTVIFDCKFSSLANFATYVKEAVKEESALNRIVIQVFNEGNAAEVQAVYPFKMLHVCMFDTDYERTVKTCIKYHMGAVSISAAALSERCGWEIFPLNNIFIYAYSVNSLYEYERLRERNVHGIFSDFLYQRDLQR